MPIGTAWNSQVINQQLTAIAQRWLEAATASQQLFTEIAGQGGTTVLESPQVGYDSADASAAMGIITSFNQVAGLLYGTGTLAAAYDFINSWAPVLNPGDIAT